MPQKFGFPLADGTVLDLDEWGDGQIPKRVGTTVVGVDAAEGTPGPSAYDVAVANGFVGTEVEWLTSLQGNPGAPGDDGLDGNDGADSTVPGPPGPAPAGTGFVSVTGGVLNAPVATCPPSVHSHAVSDTTGLQTALDARQPLDADLTAIAALVSGADKVPYATGIGAWALATLTTAGRNLIAAVDAAAQRLVLGLGSMSTVADAPSDGNTYGRLNGAWAVAGGGGASPLTMGRMAADATNNSNVNFVSLFTKPVLAGEVWSFEAVIYFLSAATTTGIVTAVDCPASPTFTRFMMSTGTSATAWLTAKTDTPGAAMVGTAGLTTLLPCYVSGTVEVGANAGNIVLKFRSEINASQITVGRGSFIRWMKH